jgi:hypothetical protein
MDVQQEERYLLQRLYELRQLSRHHRDVPVICYRCKQSIARYASLQCPHSKVCNAVSNDDMGSGDNAALSLSGSATSQRTPSG